MVIRWVMDGPSLRTGFFEMLDDSQRWWMIFFFFFRGWYRFEWIETKWTGIDFSGHFDAGHLLDIRNGKCEPHSLPIRCNWLKLEVDTSDIFCFHNCSWALTALETVLRQRHFDQTPTCFTYRLRSNICEGLWFCWWYLIASIKSIELDWISALGVLKCETSSVDICWWPAEEFFDVLQRFALVVFGDGPRVFDLRPGTASVGHIDGAPLSCFCSWFTNCWLSANYLPWVDPISVIFWRWVRDSWPSSLLLIAVDCCWGLNGRISESSSISPSSFSYPSSLISLAFLWLLFGRFR